MKFNFKKSMAAMAASAMCAFSMSNIVSASAASTTKLTASKNSVTVSSASKTGSKVAGKTSGSASTTTTTAASAKVKVTTTTTAAKIVTTTKATSIDLGSGNSGVKLNEGKTNDLNTSYLEDRLDSQIDREIGKDIKITVSGKDLAISLGKEDIFGAHFTENIGLDGIFGVDDILSSGKADAIGRLGLGSIGTVNDVVGGLLSGGRAGMESVLGIGGSGKNDDLSEARGIGNGYIGKNNGDKPYGKCPEYNHGSPRKRGNNTYSVYEDGYICVTKTDGTEVWTSPSGQRCFYRPNDSSFCVNTKKGNDDPQTSGTTPNTKGGPKTSETEAVGTKEAEKGGTKTSGTQANDTKETGTQAATSSNDQSSQTHGCTVYDDGCGNTSGNSGDHSDEGNDFSNGNPYVTNWGNGNDGYGNGSTGEGRGSNDDVYLGGGNPYITNWGNEPHFTGTPSAEEAAHALEVGRNVNVDPVDPTLANSAKIR